MIESADASPDAIAACISAIVASVQGKSCGSWSVIPRGRLDGGDTEHGGS